MSIFFACSTDFWESLSGNHHSALPPSCLDCPPGGGKKDLHHSHPSAAACTPTSSLWSLKLCLQDMLVTYWFSISRRYQCLLHIEWSNPKPLHAGFLLPHPASVCSWSPLLPPGSHFADYACWSVFVAISSSSRQPLHGQWPLGSILFFWIFIKDSLSSLTKRLQGSLCPWPLSWVTWHLKVTSYSLNLWR